MFDASDPQGRRTALLARLEATRKKLERRAHAIRRDLARMDEADRRAADARWLVAEAARAPRGATEISGTNWETSTPITFTLDPKRPARVQIEESFALARRLRGGEATAKARLEDAERRLAEVAACEAALAEIAGDDGALDAIEVRAAAATPDEVRRHVRAKVGATPEALPPHRTFTASNGARVFVGRGASRNDELTFGVAKPYWLWLHAKGLPGAHVVVPMGRDQACPADVLVDAAHLAAHFSDARGEAIVEVSYLPRKWVRKPRGAAPGAVVLERGEKVITLRVEPERVARLLAAEVNASGSP